jgi:hypothetical protein
MMTKLIGWKCFSVLMAAALILGVVATALSTAPLGAQEGTWDIQTVDDVNVISTSLALDNQGNPHIAYTTQEDAVFGSLHYASWTGTGWVTELVDAAPAVVTSLALDSQDRPHICYTTVEIGDNSLHYAHWTGTDWAIESPDSIVDTNYVSDCSLALDSQGRPHVCYIAPGVVGHELQYAWLTDTGWDHSLSTFDPESGYPNSCSLALDNLDRPHIGFATSGGSFFTVHYYHLVGGVWDDEVVYDDPATSVSIALDSQGSPHIAYATATLSSLHYASRTGEDAWTTQTVDPANASDCSLAMDSQDNPHISYHVIIGSFDDGFEGPSMIDETITGLLKYAVWTGSEWEIETVDQETVHVTGTVTSAGGASGNNPVGQTYYGFLFGDDKWCSLALDYSDLPHISYGDLAASPFGVTTLCLHYAQLVMPAVTSGVPGVPVTTPGHPKYSPPGPNTNRYLSQANMSVQFVSVNPQQASANQPVTITTNVVNTGDAAGNYNVDLKINGQVEESRMISVGPQASQPVKFTVTRDQPGTYTVDIVDQSGSFTILGDKAGSTSGQNSTGLIILVLIGVLIVVSVIVLLMRRA